MTYLNMLDLKLRLSFLTSIIHHIDVTSFGLLQTYSFYIFAGFLRRTSLEYSGVDVQTKLQALWGTDSAALSLLVPMFLKLQL